MVQVFLFGAFKYPRELTWMIGVLLLPADARHGVHRPGAALRPGRVLGARHRRGDRRPRRRSSAPRSVHLMLGGPIIAAETLSRFFALHVFVIPGAADRARRPAPAPGAEARHQRVADAGTPGEARDLPPGVRGAGRSATASPFFPDAAKRDLVFAGIVILALVACAARLRPVRPERRARPDAHRHRCRGPTSSSCGSSRVFALLPP